MLETSKAKEVARGISTSTSHIRLSTTSSAERSHLGEIKRHFLPFRQRKGSDSQTDAYISR